MRKIELGKQKMKRTHLLGLSLALLAPATLSHAGGIGAPSEAPAVLPTPVDVSTDWTGGYVGLQFGSIASGDLLAPGPLEADVDGHLYGLFAGYRYDFGQFVVGGELDYMIGSGELAQLGAPLVISADYDSLLRLGVEAGFDLGAVLVYGAAGYAQIDISAGGGSVDGSGHFYGIGADFLVTDSVVVGAEILHHQFDDLGGLFAGGELDALTFGINAALRF